MSEEKKYKNYTAADIEKYHKGLLSPKEMNELEKAALDDPFLADAMEGYRTAKINVESDLSGLEKRLQERITEKKVISIASSQNTFKWWKVAAAVVILGGLGYFVFQLSTGNKNKDVAATLKEKKSNEPAPAFLDSSKLIITDTASVVSTDKKTETIKSKAQKKEPLGSGSVANLTKTDEAKEMAAPSSIASDDKLKADSINKKESTRISTPLTLEKKAADDKSFVHGYASRKDDVQNDQLKTNYFRGRVADANNNPLPFANITNTKDNVGTYADARGNFTLISPDSVLVVQVRSVGFENNVVRLKNYVTSNNVVLQDSKATPDKIISFQKPDTNRSRKNNVQFEELEPADGWNNYNTYLANNVNVPEDVKRKPAETGQVELSFDVDENGEPFNIKVEKSLCQKCDEEAIRLIKQGPKWKKKNKKAKRVTITVPFERDR